MDDEGASVRLKGDDVTVAFRINSREHVVELVRERKVSTCRLEHFGRLGFIRVYLRMIVVVVLNDDVRMRLLSDGRPVFCQHFKGRGLHRVRGSLTGDAHDSDRLFYICKFDVILFL